MTHYEYLMAKYAPMSEEERRAERIRIGNEYPKDMFERLAALDEGGFIASHVDRMRNPLDL